MLYFNQFHNYSDFSQRFGYRTDINGNYLRNKNGIIQRKNNIVYTFYISYVYSFYKELGLQEAINRAPKCNNVNEVFDKIFEMLQRGIPVCSEGPISIPSRSATGKLMLNIDSFSNILGNSMIPVYIRKNKKVQSENMKLGKYLLNIFDDDIYTSHYKEIFWWSLIPSLKNFFIEEFTNRWVQSSDEMLNYQLVFDTDFHKAYSFSHRDINNKYFRSCMDDKPNWKFYAERSDIYSVVSLVNSENYVFARGLLINCYDENGKCYKYLDRIYSNKDIYKKVLLKLAEDRGIYDLLRDPFSSCHDSTFIFTKNKLPFKNKLFIPLSLGLKSIIAYQDTFKFYYPDLCRAYNSPVYGDNYVFLETVKLYYKDLLK